MVDVLKGLLLVVGLLGTLYLVYRTDNCPDSPTHHKPLATNSGIDV